MNENLGKTRMRFISGGGWLAVFFFLASFVPILGQPVQTFYTTSPSMNPVNFQNLSARVAAMGSAFTGIADDASALFSNPAGLRFLPRGEASFFSDLSWADSFQETVAVGLPMGNGIGAGFAGSYHGYGSMEGRDLSGSLAPGYGADRIFFQAGCGLKLIEEVSLGLGLRGEQQTLSGTGYSYLTPDFGVLINPTRGVKIGLDYINGGWSSSAGPLVYTFRGGVSWETELNPGTGILAALGGSVQSDARNYFQAGTEVSFRARYFIRAGYQTSTNESGYGDLSGLTLGGGVDLSGFRLDYAYLPSGKLGDSHRFSVTYSFESPFKTRVTLKETSEIEGMGEPAKPHREGFDKGQVSPAGEISKEDKPLEKSGKENPAGAKAGKSSKQGEVNMSFPQGSTENNQNQNLRNNPQPVTVFEKVSSREKTSLETPSGNFIGSAPKLDNGASDKDRLTLHFNIPSDFTSQGEMLEAQGHLQDALKLYQEGVRQDPNDVTAWWDMGNVYAKLGRKIYAIQCFESVLKLRPDNKGLALWLDKYKEQK